MSLVDDAIIEIVHTIEALFAGVANSVGAAFAVLSTPVVNYFNQLANSLFSFFGSVTSNLQGALLGVFDRLNSVLDSISQSIYTAVAGVVDTLAQTIQGWVSRLTGFIDSAVSAVQNFIDRALSYLTGIFTQAATALNAIAYGVINSIIALVERSTTSIENYFTGLANNTRGLIDTLEDYIRGSLDSILGATDSLIKGVSEKLGDVKDALTTSFDAFGEALKGFNVETLTPYLTHVREVLDVLVPFSDPSVLGQLTDIQQVIHDLLDPSLEPTKRVSMLLEAAKPITPVGRLFQNALLWSAAIFGLAAAPIKFAVTSTSQAIAKEYPVELLTPGETFAGVARKQLTREQAIEIGRRGGFSERDAGIAFDAGYNPPAPGDLIDLWLRGLLSEEQVDAALARVGFETAYAEAVKAGRWVIPPADDLIRIARRLVFDKSIVDKYGLAGDLQPEYLAWMLKKGVSEDWATKLWATHWDVPSVEQGFEMLQRRFIDREELDFLMRDGGVAPFWRSKLLDIAYHPITRIDIRRIYALGLMTEAEVFSAYQNLGYTEQDAEKLTQFVVQAAKPKKVGADEELGKLSRSNILEFFADGAINRQKAIGLLVTIGHTPTAAELFVEDVELKQIRAKRAADVEFVIAEVTAGAITPQQAQDQIHSLGLSPAEIERAQTKIFRAQARQTHVPSLADGTKMFQYNIISEEVYKNLLKRLGYSETWIHSFVLLAIATRKASISLGGV